MYSFATADTSEMEFCFQYPNTALRIFSYRGKGGWVWLWEGIQKKNRFFLGNSPKQRTPPTHPYGLGLT